jgi:hypothetical protein
MHLWACWEMQGVMRGDACYVFREKSNVSASNQLHHVLGITRAGDSAAW